ncbi:uncharacterized protein LOC128222185 [Mya arenaria]|uniref:uncharacterized protein LOC128222185 n=1 Tax=Mya arenaria TaxID=6604 RepID=UPI0022E4391F|nr:uncharacterized protein LOC128222185 [Mya arenaria]
MSDRAGVDDQNFLREVRRINCKFDKCAIACSAYLRDVTDNVEKYATEDIEELLEKLKKDKKAVKEMRGQANTKISEIDEVTILLNEECRKRQNKTETLRVHKGREQTRDSGYSGSTGSRVLQEKDKRNACLDLDKCEVTTDSDLRGEMSLSTCRRSSWSGPFAMDGMKSAEFHGNRSSVGASENDELALPTEDDEITKLKTV